MNRPSSCHTTPHHISSEPLLWCEPLFSSLPPGHEFARVDSRGRVFLAESRSVSDDFDVFTEFVFTESVCTARLERLFFYVDERGRDATVEKKGARHARDDDYDDDDAGFDDCTGDFEGTTR